MSKASDTEFSFNFTFHFPYWFSNFSFADALGSRANDGELFESCVPRNVESKIAWQQRFLEEALEPTQLAILLKSVVEEIKNRLIILII
jgi:hypothetical protein